MQTCTRKLEWDAMHRVPGHSGACRAFHGHRYSAEITCAGRPGEDGMIIDFGVIKRLVGAWIEENWDHTAILQKDDPDPAIQAIARSNAGYDRPVYFMDEAPTAENIAGELFRIATDLLSEETVEVVRVRVHETPNCWADYGRL